MLSGLITLLLLSPWWTAMRSGTLTDITKPYLGVYECQSAQYNDKDLLENFSYIRKKILINREYEIQQNLTQA